MKIAIISDLHRYHWEKAHIPEYPVDTVSESMKKEKPDFIIDAGDYEKHVSWDYPCLYIPGNHDYYGKVWPLDDHESMDYAASIGGIRIVMATLWTDLNKNNPVTKEVYRRTLADCHAIKGFTPDVCVDTHMRHKDFLTTYKGKVDIVVTHHCPSFQSVHPRYKNNLTSNSAEFMINYGFASDLDNFVEEMGAKYWIHGHTHDAFDYKIGKTRVICNPCGYPSERRGIPYEPVYIKI